MAEQELLEEFLRALGIVAEHHVIVEIDVGGDIGANLDPNIASSVTHDTEPCALFNGTDLHGNARDREHGTPKEVGQERLEVYRNRRPFVQENPEAFGRH